MTATPDELRRAVVAGASGEIEQLDRLVGACRRMQDELRASLDLLGDGSSMTSILSRDGADHVIPRLTEELDRTMAARRAGRGAMIRLALAEGMTTRQLAGRLGISRQLVERYRDET